MADDAKPRGSGGWRKAFLTVWGAFYILLLILFTRILPGRSYSSRSLGVSLEIYITEATDAALSVSDWVSRNIFWVCLVWVLVAAMSLVVRDGTLKVMTGLAIMSVLGVLCLGAVGILGTDPAPIILIPRVR